MGLAFFYSTNISAQWRGPLGLALVWPILLLIVICFVPESPRWLLMKGRTEEAWKVVSELHTNPNDPDQEYARGEFYQMQKQTEMDRTLNPTWKQMFVKPSYRKRAIMAIVFAFVGQSTAILVVNNYVSICPALYLQWLRSHPGSDTLQSPWLRNPRPTHPPMRLDYWRHPGKLHRSLVHGPFWPSAPNALRRCRLLHHAFHRSRHGRSLRRSWHK
jgi:MFS family permease